MTGQTHDRAQLERLTFFSDAVFAIAITLLVIEIRLPAIHDPSEIDLANALLRLIPQYIGFIVSFFVIGRFWIGHHRVFGWLDRVDDGLVWRNLLFLLTIAFMPFPTAIVSHYVDTRVGVGVYAVWLIFAGLFNINLVRYATRGPLVAAGVDIATVHTARGPWVPIVTGVLALGCAIYNPVLALIPLMASPLIARLIAKRQKAAA